MVIIFLVGRFESKCPNTTKLYNTYISNGKVMIIHLIVKLIKKAEDK